METVTNVKVIRRGVIGFKGQCRFKPSTVVGGKGGALMAPEQCPVHQLSGTGAPVLVVLEARGTWILRSIPIIAEFDINIALALFRFGFSTYI